MTSAIEHRLSSIEKIVKSLAGKGSQDLKPVWMDCKTFCATANKTPRQFELLRSDPIFRKCFGKLNKATKRPIYYINYPKYLEVQNELIVPIAD